MRLFWLIFLIHFCLTNGSVLTWEEASQYTDSDGIINVTEENYELLGKGMRDFYSVLFITSDEPNQNGDLCDLCRDFEPNMRIVSRSIRNQLSDEDVHRIFFFKVDVAYNPTFLKEFQVTKIPFCLVYPPQIELSDDGQEFAWKHSPFYQYVIKKEFMDQPLHFGEFLANILNVFLSIEQPFEYDVFFKTFAIYVILFLIFKKKVMPLVQNKAKFFLVLFSLAVIFLSITGFKFTSMNHIAFIVHNDKDEIAWFSGGAQYQFGIEILTVSCMYFGMGLCTVLLVLIPKMKSFNAGTTSVLTVSISAALFVLYMFFLSCFKIKDPGYPFVYLF